MVSPITQQIGRPQQIDFGQSLLAGQQNYQNLQRGQLQNRAMQQDLANTDFGMQMRNLRIMTKLLKQARATPPELRDQFVASLNQPMLASIGVTPEDLANTPRDDAGLDQLIGQADAALSAAMPQGKNRVQSSQILDNGTVVTVMSDGGVQVKDAQGRILSGQQAAEAVRSAQEYATGLQGARAGARTQESLSARLASEPELRSRLKSAEQDIKGQTEPRIQAAITEARTKAKLEAERSIKQQGQMTKLSDADRLYQSLSMADLDLIYGKGEQWYPEFFRSQKGIDLIAQRDQLVGMLNLAARGQLAGQGAVSDSEAKSILQAATTLASPNISPEEARSALDSAMNSIYKNAGQDFNPSKFSGSSQPSIEDLVNQYAD